MSHDHGHDHAHGLTGRRLRTAVALTCLILAVEVVGAFLSHSLALLSDAGHVLTDIGALGLAWFATAQAERPADARKTYGYHRTGILAALANAVTLIAIVLAIAVEAVQRLQHPQAVTPSFMFIAAATAIAVNLWIAHTFSKEGGENLNVRAALLHVIGDVGASMAVVLGGLVILVTGWSAVDPLLSLLITVLIARGAWSILGDAVRILMEATPKGLDLQQLADDVVRLPAVTEVHDLHVWSIAGGMTALSAHLQVADDCALSSCDALLDEVHRLLEDHYAITHSTIQFEYACCGRHAPDDLYCALVHGEESAPCRGHHADAAYVQDGEQPVLQRGGCGDCPS